MGYSIYSESIVYYALRDQETGKYLHQYEGGGRLAGLHDCTMYASLDEAKSIRRQFPSYTEIRRVKVVDIGAVRDD